MYLTPKRISRQLERADKLQRILWRLYSPAKSHRKLIVKASAHIMEAVDIIEELLRIVDEENRNKIQKKIDEVNKEGTNDNC
jgi:hypothetical protein